MLPVQCNFVIDGLLVRLQLIFRKSVVSAVFRDAEVLKIGFAVTLPDSKVRRIRLTCKEDVIPVQRLILVFNAIQVQEISDLHFLVRSHHFTLDGDGLLGSRIDDLLLEIIQLTSHRRKVGFCYVVEKSV